MHRETWQFEWNLWTVNVKKNKRQWVVGQEGRSCIFELLYWSDVYLPQRSPRFTINLITLYQVHHDIFCKSDLWFWINQLSSICLCVYFWSVTVDGDTDNPNDTIMDRPPLDRALFPIHVLKIIMNWFMSLLLPFIFPSLVFSRFYSCLR